MRSFDPTLITIRNNPFPTARAKSIEDGIFMKHLIDPAHPYISNTDPYIPIGIISRLLEKIKEIEEAKTSQHVLILGEYGQGKSFSLKVIQDELYVNYNSAIISYSIGGNASSIIQNEEYFQERIMEDIERLFQAIDSSLYTEKHSIDHKYKLSTGSGRTFHQFLKAYDNVFSDLQIQVYIFIDELDKIILSTTGDNKIIIFLENIKLIADICDKSISILAAGTPNCLLKMNQLSIDYAQRFDPIENNFLTLDNTIAYINKKCASKLTHVGYYPFTKQVIRKICSLSQGNIRKIEIICRDLWISCFRDHIKVDLKYLNKLLQKKLFEPILKIFPPINNKTVEFIATLFINGGRLPKVHMTEYPLKNQQEINTFLSSTEKIRVIKKSYVMSTDLMSQIGDSLFN